MAKKKTAPKQTSPAAGGPKPKLWISPDAYLFRYHIQVFGADWGYCPVTFLLDDEGRVRPARVLAGEARLDAVEPIRGEFMVLLNTPGLKAGQHRITAVSGNPKASVAAAFSILETRETE